ncbi:TolC family protein [Chitinophaga sp. Cy-1792]|uniref:TolC family protein n=1 Tax=Chitinophaga sp. Cy-1792 TaxID=2608339 RepID=UPI001423E1DB|nr:TolC family protein [Chitinophaga sp. Cy-1792]NIG56080.1 TolC family protein [Chitinophaga sp. Cy-1792]
MKQIPVIIFPLICTISVSAQQNGGELTLKDCYRIAKQGNVVVQQAQHSLKAREYALQADNRAYYPKVDLLAGYNYLGQPLKINLQQVKDGVVNGSAAQSANTANEVYHQITGQNLPQAAQDKIAAATKTLINAFYPDYNPELAKQSYFTAGLFLRQPIYMGGKITAAQDLAKANVRAGEFNQQLVEKELSFGISAQYLRILYLNTIMAHEAVIVDAFRKNRDYATSLKDNQILPPYLLNWARVSYTQAINRYANLELDKQNALLELNKLLGQPLGTPITITDTLRYSDYNIGRDTTLDLENNATYRLVQNTESQAQVAVKATRSLSMPNIFAIGNVNLYQKDLPVTVPPWLVGVEMQWNIFDGFSRVKRTRASQQLVEEAKLAAENTKSNLELKLAIAKNKMASLRNTVASLDSARQQSRITTTLITDRMQNELSSVKDVNDALLMEEEMEKTYYTAVLGYYLAMAEYWNVLGTPEEFAVYIDGTK